jgi:hypothetical protein
MPTTAEQIAAREWARANPEAAAELGIVVPKQLAAQDVRFLTAAQLAAAVAAGSFDDYFVTPNDQPTPNPI